MEHYIKRTFFQEFGLVHIILRDDFIYILNGLNNSCPLLIRNNWSAMLIAFHTRICTDTHD